MVCSSINRLQISLNTRYRQISCSVCSDCIILRLSTASPKDGLRLEGEPVDTSTLKKLHSLSTSDHQSLDMQKMLWPEAPYLMLCPGLSNQTVPLLPPEACYHMNRQFTGESI